MRKFFFILLAVFCSLNTLADDGDKFVGIWQMVSMKGARFGSVPILKQYTENGKYHLYQKANDSYDFFITSEGTYQLGEKGHFTEILGEKSVLNAGKKSHLEYTFSEDGSLMFLKYAIEGTRVKREEIWRRVTNVPKELFIPNPQIERDSAPLIENPVF